MSTSQRSAQGSGLALEVRRISPHSRTPYGTYRLYCRPDHTPLYVIVDKRNGLQEKRSWPDLNLIDTYGHIGGGRVGHYKKQKSELVYLVPGDPKEQETIRSMMRWHYLDGLGAKRIAGRLNASGTPAPMGGKWSNGQVDNILMNEDYTGVGVANRKSQAVFNRRSSRGPVRVTRDPELIATAARIPVEILPKENWFEGEEPYLRDYLGDDHLREVVSAAQSRRWERRLDPKIQRPNKRKYHLGPYILHPLLRDNTDEHEALVGSVTGRSTSPRRIYRHKRAVREAQKGSIWGRTLDAEALEKAVLAVLRDTLLDWPELEARLLAHVGRHLSNAGQSDDLLAAKREQRQEVADQLLVFARMLTKKTQESLAPEIARLERQRDALDDEIVALEARSTHEHLDPATITSSLRRRIERLADDLETLPNKAIADVLSHLTDRLEVDLATKEVEFAFHFPTCMLHSDAKTPLSAMCTRTSSEFSTGERTHRDPLLSFELATGMCAFRKEWRSVSCQCHRSKRAA